MTPPPPEPMPMNPQDLTDKARPHVI